MSGRVLFFVATFVAAVAFGLHYEKELSELGSSSEDWKPVCVHGQLVYRANYSRKGMAVNALTEDGKPVSCRVGEYIMYND
ncbi:MAG: hypothetical protein GY833_21845 [Aestuariibacter sp.]|nr:hypothetical protein [Aestuariibacter sp.]